MFPSPKLGITDRNSNDVSYEVAVIFLSGLGEYTFVPAQAGYDGCQWLNVG
jgi:hypothetical protein